MNIPTGAYAIELTCPKCKTKFESWTEANMSDPEVAMLVSRLMSATICDRCKTKSDRENQHYKPPWEQPRPQ